MKLFKRIEFYLFVILLISPSPTLAQVFKWMDDKGNMHFTDSANKIPLKYRKAPKKSSEAPVIKNRVKIGGGYSFEIAENWDVETRGSLQYKLMFTKKRNGYEPSCALDEFKDWGSFKNFVTEVQAVIRKRFKKYKKNSQSTFYAKHLKGIKMGEQLVDMSGTNVRRFLYYFKISKGKKIVITCIVAEETGAVLNNAFDEIASSLISE